MAGEDLLEGDDGGSNDTSPAKGGKKKHKPLSKGQKIGVVIGVVTIVLVIYQIRKSNAASASTTSSIDPATGYPTGSAQDLAALAEQQGTGSAAGGSGSSIGGLSGSGVGTTDTGTTDTSGTGSQGWWSSHGHGQGSGGGITPSADAGFDPATATATQAAAAGVSGVFQGVSEGQNTSIQTATVNGQSYYWYGGAASAQNPYGTDINGVPLSGFGAWLAGSPASASSQISTPAAASTHLDAASQARATLAAQPSGLTGAARNKQEVANRGLRATAKS